MNRIDRSSGCASSSDFVRIVAGMKDFGRLELTVIGSPSCCGFLIIGRCADLRSV
jgi:hypothetical protein